MIRNHKSRLIVKDIDGLRALQPSEDEFVGRFPLLYTSTEIKELSSVVIRPRLTKLNRLRQLTRAVLSRSSKSQTWSSKFWHAMAAAGA